MKERIAIFLDTEKNSGGAYQELVYMIEKIDSLNNNQFEIVIISTIPNLQLTFGEKKFKIYYLSMNSFERYIGFLRNYGPFVRRLKK